MDILTQIAARTGHRLLAVAAEKEPIDPVAIMFGTVLHHLKQHGLKADFPDDDQNSLMVQGSMAQVLMGLSSLGWTHGQEEPVVGGMYCSGSAVTIESATPLRVMQTSIDRVLIWQAQDPSTIPQENPNETPEDEEDELAEESPENPDQE